MVSTTTHSWVESHSDEQRKLIRELLGLQEQSVLPSYITVKHLRSWIMSHARTAFLEKFQEQAAGNNLHLVGQVVLERDHSLPNANPTTRSSSERLVCATKPVSAERLAGVAAPYGVVVLASADASTSGVRHSSAAQLLSGGDAGVKPLRKDRAQQAHHAIHLASLHLAQQVYHRYRDDQEESVLGQRTVMVCPLRPAFRIKGELVDDFVVKLLLKLHRLNGCGAKQPSQQDLLVVCLEIGASIIGNLRRMPGVNGDEKQLAPICNLRTVVVQCQAALIGMFGTTIRQKKLVAMRDTAVLSTIPQVVVEGVSTIHQALSDPAGDHQGLGRPALSDAHRVLETLFSHLLLPSLNKSLCIQFGWKVRGESDQACPLLSSSTLDNIRRILAGLVTTASAATSHGTEVREATRSVLQGLFKAVDRSQGDSAVVPIQRALCDIQSTVTETAASVTKVVPKSIVVHVSSLRRVVSQTYFLINQDAFEGRKEVYVEASVCGVQALLSSFPWVHVTEDEQLANTLTTSDLTLKVTKNILDNLHKVLGSSVVLSRALEDESKILTRYVIHLASLHLAQQVPDRYLDDQEQNVLSQRMAMVCPLRPAFTINAELVDDFVVKLLLKLHPLNGRGTKQLSQQDLLVLCLKIGASTIGILRRMPGVTVDEKQLAPICNLRTVVVQYQAAMIRKFGTTIRLKKLVAMRDPTVLSTIPHVVVEGILTIHQALYDPAADHRALRSTALAEADEAMEKKLFSHLLPQSLRKSLCLQFGWRVRHMKMFRRAFMTDADLRAYRQSVEPRLSSRDVVWVDDRHLTLVGNDDYEEKEEERPPGNTVLESPLALTCTKEAFLQQFPLIDIFGETQTDLVDFEKAPRFDSSKDNVQVTGKTFSLDNNIQKGRVLADGDSHGVHGSKVSASDASLRKYCVGNTRSTFLNKWLDQGDKIKAAVAAGAVDEATQKKTTETQQTADTITVSDNILFYALLSLFQLPQYLTKQPMLFNMMEHVSFLLRDPLYRYRKNRVFLKNLKALDDPKKLRVFVADFSRRVSHEFRPKVPMFMWPCGDGLNMGYLSGELLGALLLCDIAAKCIVNMLKPTVDFASGTKKGDDTKFSVNLPLKREVQGERPRTKLEQQVEDTRIEYMELMKVPLEKDYEYWMLYYYELKSQNNGVNVMPPEFAMLEAKFEPKPKSRSQRLRDWLQERCNSMFQRRKKEKIWKPRRDCFYSYYYPSERPFSVWVY